MNANEIKLAVNDAARFIDAATEYLRVTEAEKKRYEDAVKKGPNQHHWHETFPAESGMVRNASLVLWRQLARMRRSQHE